MGGYRYKNGYGISNDGVANALNQSANTLNNVAWVMMSKMKSPEELELLRERAAASQASARLHQLQGDALEADAADRAGAGDRLLYGSGFTDPQIKAYRNYQKTGQWEGEQLPPDTYGPPAPGSAKAHGISDAMMAGANAMDAAYAMSRGKNINPDNVAKAVRGFMQNNVIAPVMAGGAAPTNLTDMARVDRAFDGSNPVFSQGANGVVLNNVQGTVDTSNPMARASIGATNALAGERSAAAGAHNANRDLLISKGKPVTATVGGQQVTGPVSVMAPVMGAADRNANTNTSRENAAQIAADARVAASAGKGGAVGKDPFKALSTQEREQVIDAVSSLMPADYNNSMIDKKTMGAILSWASFNMRDPNSPARGNPHVAVANAIRQVTNGAGVELSGMYGMRKVTPVGGGEFNLTLPEAPPAPSATGVTNAMVNSAVPPGQRPAPKVAVPAAAPAGQQPVIGEVRKGYKYIGGDPAQQGSWELVKEG